MNRQMDRQTDRQTEAIAISPLLFCKERGDNKRLLYDIYILF